MQTQISNPKSSNINSKHPWLGLSQNAGHDRSLMNSTSLAAGTYRLELSKKYMNNRRPFDTSSMLEEPEPRIDTFKMIEARRQTYGFEHRLKDNSERISMNLSQYPSVEKKLKNI